jgi:acetyltransferase-like isoleucine patch superfamily enzyme
MSFMSLFSVLIFPFKVFFVICSYVNKCGKKGRILLQRAEYKIPSNVVIGDLNIIGDNFIIGEFSYFNSGYVSTNKNAGVQIGKWCALGHNVTLLAITHDAGIPTGVESKRPIKSGDVIIEDGVWIGNNVIVTPGIHIGRQVVIGGNSVVTKDLPDYSVCSGNPCKVIYVKSEADILKHNEIISL